MMIILLQEEAELRSDGTQNTIKPSQVSVARVSCIRGLVLYFLKNVDGAMHFIYSLKYNINTADNASDMN